MTFFLPGNSSYVGSKLLSTSTPRPFFGKSMMWPTEAMTLKSLPRYLLIVFAFDGDSTITSDLDITHPNASYVCRDAHNKIYRHGEPYQPLQKANQITRTRCEVQAAVRREWRVGGRRRVLCQVRMSRIQSSDSD